MVPKNVRTAIYYKKTLIWLFEKLKKKSVNKPIYLQIVYIGVGRKHIWS